MLWLSLMRLSPGWRKTLSMEVAQGFRFKLLGNRAKSAAQSTEELESEPEDEFLTSPMEEDLPEEAPANVKRLRDLIEAARANRTDLPIEDEVSEDSDWDEPVIFADPLVEVVTPPLEPPVLEVVPEPLWAEGGLARRRPEPEPKAADLSPRFSAPQELTHQELLDELELLMRAVQSGSVSEGQLPALTSLIRSLRTLVD